MAANKQQGSYLILFWTALTFLCAGLAYLAEGWGKLVLLLGAAGVVLALIGFAKLKSLEGKTHALKGSAGGKLVGLVLAWAGWLVTIAGLHLTSSTAGRLLFALAGIGVSLVGVLGVLPVAFGRVASAKPAPLKAMEQSR